MARNQQSFGEVIEGVEDRLYQFVRYYRVFISNCYVISKYK